MALTKLITNIFGINDYSLRLLPFLTSIGCLILFWVTLKYYLKSNVSKYFAFFLFIINSAIIYYATEFKQYGCDVFAILLVIYLFNKLNFENYSRKKLICIGCFLAIISWFSFISMLAIAGGIIYLLIKKETRKAAVYISLPLIINSLIYTKVILLQTYNDSFMVKIWQHAFIKYNFSNFPRLFIGSIAYMFAPIKLLLLLLVLLITGAAMYIKSRTRNSIILGLIFE